MKKAFTLAEVIVVLTLLGTVAAITIPNALNNSSNKSNIVKVKKAISAFDKFVETVRVTENLTSVYNKDNSNDTSTLFGFIKQNDNCSKGKEYFKIKKNIDETCQFQTYDGLWWNIANIRKTIIATDDKCKDYTVIPINETDACYNKVFYMTVSNGDANNGYAFKINDYSNDPQNRNNLCPILNYAKIINEKCNNYNPLSNFNTLPMCYVTKAPPCRQNFGTWYSKDNHPLIDVVYLSSYNLEHAWPNIIYNCTEDTIDACTSYLMIEYNEDGSFTVQEYDMNGKFIKEQSRNDLKNIMWNYI